jgi:hypothetical protein
LNYNLKEQTNNRKMSDNTQLTTASGYDTKRMIFSEAQQGSIPNSVPAINYRRISIQTRNEDGTTGDLIFPTSQLFSFGVSENTNPETGKVNGYVMPLCLWNRDGASKDEKAWSDTFDKVIEKCKEHIVANREEIEQYDLAMTDLKKFNPLYWKKDKGKVVEGSGPTLYANLIVSKKQNKIVSMFYDNNGDEVDPLTLLGKYCYSTAAVKIESIFVGNKISMQVKLYECEVRLMDSGMKRMMKKRPEGHKRVLVSQSSKPLEEKEGDYDTDTASVKDSDDDADEQVKPVEKSSPKKVTRRVKKIVRKSAVVDE